MRVSDFHFDLPESLIALYPTPTRTACRLLILNGENGHISDGIFTDIIDLVEAGDLLVFNNTQVIPARLYGKKASGGRVEVLVERLLDQLRVLAHIKASKAPKENTVLILGENETVNVTMIARHGALFELQFDTAVLPVLHKIGHVPLPPYIDRADEVLDQRYYQTVYSEKPGAVAAPTAGLHFDHAMIEALKAKQVEVKFVTLHVGAGTFLPVRVDNVLEHTMHAEYVDVGPDVVEAVAACKQRGKRVIAVGTTSVRSLESAAQETGQLACFKGDTSIFIYPGYHFNVVDAMITNFHLPSSTLIMLVSAFVGYHNTMNAYATAIDRRYRFFSYGDAMFISKNSQAENETVIRTL